MKLKDPSKARHAMRQFKSSSFKGKTPWENNALEDNVAIIITRASLKEFGLLANQFKKYRRTCFLFASRPKLPPCLRNR